jgi:hypothetical protein
MFLHYPQDHTNDLTCPLKFWRPLHLSLGVFLFPKFLRPLQPASAQPYSAEPFLKIRSPRLPIAFLFIFTIDGITLSWFFLVAVAMLPDSPLLFNAIILPSIVIVLLQSIYPTLQPPDLQHQQISCQSMTKFESYTSFHDVAFLDFQLQILQSFEKDIYQYKNFQAYPSDITYIISMVLRTQS